MYFFIPAFVANHFAHGCMLIFAFLISVFLAHFHTVMVSAWVMIPLVTNHNSAIISVPPGTEKHQFSTGRQRALTVTICYICLTITVMLISEQPENTS